MNQVIQKFKTTRVRRLLVTTIALGCAFTTAAHAQYQTDDRGDRQGKGHKIVVPTTPTLITPREGNTVFAVGHAEGTQGYVCLPTAPGASTASWTVNGARPEATLFAGEDVQIITHFLSPNTNPNGAQTPVPFGNATWQSSHDTSKVWAAVLHNNVVVAGTDLDSCPNNGSIPCLLLETVGSEEGPQGGTMLSKTTFVQRLNTNGGSAPATGCFTSADVGHQSLVPYTADYFFYRKSN